MKRAIILASMLCTLSFGMQYPPLSDQEVSNELRIRKGKIIPVFPEATEAQDSDYFSQISAKTIYQGKLWTFRKTKKAGFCTISGSKIFKRSRWGVIKEIFWAKNTESESSLVRTEENGEIWDLLECIVSEKIMRLANEED